MKVTGSMAPIYTPGRSFSRRPFHFRRTRPKTVSSLGRVNTAAGPFLFLVSPTRCLDSLRCSADPLALSTTRFKASTAASREFVSLLFPDNFVIEETRTLFGYGSHRLMELTGSRLICFCTRGRVIRVNFNLVV